MQIKYVNWYLYNTLPCIKFCYNSNFISSWIFLIESRLFNENCPERKAFFAVFWNISPWIHETVFFLYFLHFMRSCFIRQVIVQIVQYVIVSNRYCIHLVSQMIYLERKLRYNSAALNIILKTNLSIYNLLKEKGHHFCERHMIFIRNSPWWWG